ncbi:MAG TPA: hypothetical protein VFW10_00520 [Steroidobacteraceae bacterium]|nr:hypothetical protein [Steroidobacteraceae bacterium]
MTLLTAKIRAAMVWIFIAVILWQIEPARASDASIDADVRCIVVALHLLASQEPRQREIGIMAGLYFFGRLDGQSPNADIEHLIKSVAAQMTDAEFKSEAVRCGKSLQTKGQEITRIGIDMSKKK